MATTAIPTPIKETQLMLRITFADGRSLLLATPAMLLSSAVSASDSDARRAISNDVSRLTAKLQDAIASMDLTAMHHQVVEQETKQAARSLTDNPGVVG